MVEIKVALISLNFLPFFCCWLISPLIQFCTLLPPNARFIVVFFCIIIGFCSNTGLRVVSFACDDFSSICSSYDWYCECSGIHCRCPFLKKFLFWGGGCRWGARGWRVHRLIRPLDRSRFDSPLACLMVLSFVAHLDQKIRPLDSKLVDWITMHYGLGAV